jgi:hypothetical protein
MSSFCDKDRTFYGNNRGTEAFNSIQSSPRSQSLGVSKNENEFKALRKHDKVRQQKDEFEKITRIERDLSESVELRQVSKVQDTDEFEVVTNKEFNTFYEKSLMSSNQTVRPLIKSRGTRRAEA